MQYNQWNQMPDNDRKQILEALGSQVCPEPEATSLLTWGALPAQLKQVLRDA